MSWAGVGLTLCSGSKVSACQVSEWLNLPSADRLHGDADLIFQKVTTAAHTANSRNTWFKDRGVPVLELNQEDMKI